MFSGEFIDEKASWHVRQASSVSVLASSIVAMRIESGCSISRGAHERSGYPIENLLFESLSLRKGLRGWFGKVGFNGFLRLRLEEIGDVLSMIHIVLIKDSVALFLLLAPMNQPHLNQESRLNWLEQ